MMRQDPATDPGRATVWSVARLGAPVVFVG